MHKIICLIYLLFAIAYGKVLWSQGQDLNLFQKSADVMAKGIALDESLVSVSGDPKAEGLDKPRVTLESFRNFSFETKGHTYIFNLKETHKGDPSALEIDFSFNGTSIAKRTAIYMNSDEEQQLKEVMTAFARLPAEADKQIRRDRYNSLVALRDGLKEKNLARTSLGEGIIIFDLGYWKHYLKLDDIKIIGDGPGENPFSPTSRQNQENSSVNIARDFSSLLNAGIVDSMPLICARINYFGTPLDAWMGDQADINLKTIQLAFDSVIPTKDPDHAVLRLGSTEGKLLTFPKSISLLPLVTKGYINIHNNIQPFAKENPELCLDVLYHTWVIGGRHRNGRIFVASRWQLPSGFGTMVAVQYEDESTPRMAYFDLSGAIVKIQDRQLEFGFLVAGDDDANRDWKVLWAEQRVRWNNLSGNSTTFGKEVHFKALATIPLLEGTGTMLGPDPRTTATGSTTGRAGETYDVHVVRLVQPRALN